MRALVISDIHGIKSNLNIIKEKYNTMNPYPMGMDNYPERDNGDIYTNNFPEYDDTIFMNQKFNTALKNRKKYNQV